MNVNRASIFRGHHWQTMCCRLHPNTQLKKLKFVTCTCTDSHHLCPRLSHGLSCEQGKEASKLVARTCYSPYNNSKSWIKSAILEMLNVFSGRIEREKIVAIKSQVPFDLCKRTHQIKFPFKMYLNKCQTKWLHQSRVDKHTLQNT
jgi:hypothetical protein